MRSLSIVFCLASAHFVITLSLHSLSWIKLQTGQPAGALHGVVEVLYFPIISLALYPPLWFPGDWIYLPMFLNSFLWAMALWVCLPYMWRRLRSLLI